MAEERVFSEFKEQDAEDLFFESTMEVHEERSEKAQDTDEGFNAPITDSEMQWEQNPDRWDMLGIDTIPPERRMERATEAALKAIEEGIVSDVKKEELSGRRGVFRPHTPDSDTAGEVAIKENIRHEEGRTTAHEIGHAIDEMIRRKKAGDDDPVALHRRLSEEVLPGEGFSTVPTGEGEVQQEEAEKITERMRGRISASREDYRKNRKELIADFFSSYIIEPRAAKREAPHLFEAVDERLDEEDFPF